MKETNFKVIKGLTSVTLFKTADFIILIFFESLYSLEYLLVRSNLK